MYRRHLDLMVIPVHSPFFARRHHRPAMITRRQYALVAMVQSGWSGDQRSLARRMGYSLGGLNVALQSLRGLGIVAMRTTRGRFGRTALNIVRGVHVTNVHDRSHDVVPTSGNDGMTAYNVNEHIDTLINRLRHLIGPDATGANAQSRASRA